MKRRLVVGLAALLAAAMAVSACGAGSTVTLKKDFTGFSRIEIENAFNVEIVQAATFTTSVTVSKDLVDYLAISQEGGVLVIRLVPHHPFTDFTLKRLTAKARVTMPAISGLKLSGASRASLTGFKSTDSFELSLSGASSLTMNQMETGPAEFDVSGASRVNGQLKATQVALTLTGASQIELTGAADAVRFDVSGASRLEMSYFTVATADAIVSGASQVSIDAHTKLDYTLSGASQLYFRSNPTLGRQDISGASTIKHK